MTSFFRAGHCHFQWRILHIFFTTCCCYRHIRILFINVVIGAKNGEDEDAKTGYTRLELLYPVDSHFSDAGAVTIPN